VLASARPPYRLPPFAGLSSGTAIVLDDGPRTKLPALPRLGLTDVGIVGTSVNVSVEPLDGALDYRIYALPPDEDVEIGADGKPVVRNALYRCAGDRQAPPTILDGARLPQSYAVKTLTDGSDVDGFERTLANAALGYVYTTPGPGRVPVYALGNPSPDADNSCFFQRWGASRAKRYVTSASERAQLVGDHWRDDGVAFYALATETDGSVPIYSKDNLYYAAGAESDERGSGSTAFYVAKKRGPGSTQLMRVYYESICGGSHDELVAGHARFERARKQGDQQPLWDLRYSGVEKATTLVVEALDQGCPYRGMLAPVARPAWTGDDVEYPALESLDSLRAKTKTGEVYVNGQHDASSSPHAIARGFIDVKPAEAPGMDWYESFDAAPASTDYAGAWDAPCGVTNCWKQHRERSRFADVTFSFVGDERFVMAPMLGELWILYGDVGADVGAELRMTPAPKPKLVDDTFLYVTMEVDSFTTARRYPQILISDRDAPVGPQMPSGNTLIVETFSASGTTNWPNAYQLEVCDHREWTVANHCPTFDFYHVREPGDPDTVARLAPTPEVAEHTGVDRATRWDVFVSARRAYLFLDGEPFGCAELPRAGVPRGSVTVTFGDVLYHSGVDEVFAFHESHHKTVTRRHFDNLGFKSGMTAPPWDEGHLPCVRHLSD
jgi:hypothetical protein